MSVKKTRDLRVTLIITVTETVDEGKEAAGLSDGSAQDVGQDFVERVSNEVALIHDNGELYFSDDSGLDADEKVIFVDAEWASATVTS